MEARAQTWAGNPERASDLYLACACVEQLRQPWFSFLPSMVHRCPTTSGVSGATRMWVD